MLCTISTDRHSEFTSRDDEHDSCDACLYGRLLRSWLKVRSSLAFVTADLNSSRSRIFSLSYGLLFVGIALGPTFGGFLVRYTHQILFPFYVAAGMHVVYALIMWLVVPESLSSVQMIKSVEKWRAKTAHGLPTESWKKMFKFLTPLNIFFSERDDGNSLRRRCDWNLVLVVVAYGFTVSLVVCFCCTASFVWKINQFSLQGSWTYKLQYAQSTFGWTSEEVSSQFLCERALTCYR